MTIPLPDRYRDPRRLAAGGMATVYAVQDTLLGREVAIKVLHPHVTAGSDARERFAREARAAARVSDHLHVVTIYDIGEKDHVPFIVMELMSGGSIGDRLRSGDPIPRRLALRWLNEAASALDHAHRHGIVHRDVKPGNLLLDERQRLAVGDFGIARMAADSDLTQTGLVLGTAAYLSPEQARGESATAASDQYALAVVAYELLTGQRPSSEPSGLPRAAERVLRRSLEENPARRWETACRFVEALTDALDEQPATTRTAHTARVAPAPAPSRRGRHVPTKALAAAAALIAGAAVAAFALSGGAEEPTDRVAANTGKTQKAASRTTTPKTKAKAKTQTQTQTQATPQEPAPAPTPEPQPEPEPAPQPAGDPAALQAQGHQLLTAGDAAGAIPVLQQAIVDCPVAQTDPCAYAYFDLGQALRVAGRPQEAIPVLMTRLQNDDQRGTVMAELREAQKAAGVKGLKAPKGAEDERWDD